MKHIEVSEFLVTQGEMQAFTSAMQTWESGSPCAMTDNECRTTAER